MKWSFELFFLSVWKRWGEYNLKADKEITLFFSIKSEVTSLVMFLGHRDGLFSAVGHVALYPRLRIEEVNELGILKNDPSISLLTLRLWNLG